MSDIEYYDGTKVLSMKDINGLPPELILVTTNRTGGKTTFFGRYVVKRYLKRGDKFVLIYRYNYEIDDVSDKFFKDLSTLFFNGMEMTYKKRARGMFAELFLDKKSCGYAISLNNADGIKRYSHLFSDVKVGIFDEFQSETNHYCDGEIQKLLSVHTSIARGQGEQVRFVPFILIGNTVSLINPYYVELGIADRLREDTKFLRGDGFVLEQGYVETASRAQKESGMNRAFSSNKYVAYSSENVYLNDNKAFIDKPQGIGRYVCTIKMEGCNFAVREYADLGYLYVDDKPDLSFRLKIVATTDDHDVNYIMLHRNDYLINNFRSYFEKGCFRFKDLRCKQVLLKLISY
ncbi:MAG: phage DNA encapsidation protein [Methanobrevibacter sp.]|nr:phage DNA encapsidation protein [Methanobrevibacter sp.]